MIHSSNSNDDTTKNSSLPDHEGVPAGFPAPIRDTDVSGPASFPDMESGQTDTVVHGDPQTMAPDDTTLHGDSQVMAPDDTAMQDDSQTAAPDDTAMQDDSQTAASDGTTSQEYSQTAAPDDTALQDDFQTDTPDVITDESVTDSEENDESAGIIRRIARHYHRAFTVDFEKPFSFREQFLIMLVILFFSAAIFSLVYLSGMGRGVKVAPAAQTSETAAPSDDAASLPEETSLPAEGSAESLPSQSGTGKSSAVSSSGSTHSDAPESSVIPVSDKLGNLRMLPMDNEKIHYGSLVLVDKECQCTLNGENTAPLYDGTDISYAVANDKVMLDKDIIEPFNKMMDDFYIEFGHTEIMVACGYRSIEEQALLYTEEVESVGEESADQWVAPPGFSEHQTGYALDLNLNNTAGSGIKYDGTSVYAWINENCCKYGFVVRYPLGKESITGYAYEPWHFRYVGIPSALYMKRKDMTLEEYIEVIHTHRVEDPLLIKDTDQSWYVYYVPADTGSESSKTDLPVPAKGEYIVSGDNYSGFIIQCTAEDSADRQDGAARSSG